jgi:hypothetical protein
MECERLLGTILDTAAGVVPHSMELQAHLRSCATCSTRFENLRQTADILDEWKCPEPSSSFDSNLRARLLDVQVIKGDSWLVLLFRPAWAIGLATILFIGLVAVRHTMHSHVSPPAESGLQASPGSAVEDLQTLEEVDTVSTDLDLLDDLAPSQEQTTNQD